MNKIEFDIKLRTEIEAGKYKVKLNNGSEARIVCWDAGDQFPIEAINNGSPRMYTDNGKSVTGLDPLNLYLVPAEPELTEFEKAVYKTFYPFILPEFDPDLERVKTTAQTLLDVARKQLKQEIDEERCDSYQRGLDAARIDLPWWRKSNLVFSNARVIEGFSQKDLYYKGYLIDVDYLFNKLQKEE